MPSHATNASRRDESTSSPCRGAADVRCAGRPRSARVDHHDLVARLHVDEHVPGAGVVLDVPRLAAESDRCDPAPRALITVSTPPLSSETKT